MGHGIGLKLLSSILSEYSLALCDWQQCSSPQARHVWRQAGELCVSTIRVLIEEVAI